MCSLILGIVVGVPLVIFAAVYVGVATGRIPDEQGRRHVWQGAAVELGEPVRYLGAVGVLAVGVPLAGVKDALSGRGPSTALPEATRQSREWRRSGGTGYAPRRLHPPGSCSGEAE